MKHRNPKTRVHERPHGFRLKFQRVTRDGKMIGPVLWFTGRALSNTSAPRTFRTLAAANRTLNFLRRRYHTTLLDYYQAIVEVKRKSNPDPRSAVDEATRRFKAFSGHTPGPVRRISVRTPKAMLAVGELDGLLYTTDRDNNRESYIHKFRKKSRPLLAASSDGTQLAIVGGRFEFTEAGIEDR